MYTLTIRSLIIKWREFIVLAISISIASAAAWFFIIPQVGGIQALFGEQGVLKQRLTKLATKNSQLDTVSEQILRSQMDRATTVLPPSKDVPGIYEDLVKVETASGITIDSVSLVPGNISKVSVEKSEDLDLTLSSRGTLEGMRAFLSNVLQLTRLMTLTSVRYGIGDTTGSSLQMSLKTYFMGLPTVLPRLEDPIPTLSEEEVKVLEAASSAF